MKVHLTAWAIGQVAGELLAAGGPATVMGVTSRGVFLRLGQGVVFLSSEPYRGPLTVNLVAGLPPGLEAGMQIAFDVILSDSDVILSYSDVILSDSDVILSDSEVILSDSEGSALSVHTAYPKLPSDFAWDGAGVKDRLTRMIELVLAARPHGETNDLLRELRPEAALPDLLPLLGRGEGLTPWGDDLIIGLLLARHSLQPDDDFTVLAGQLTAAAFSKTSLLSANLIACAARGLADERLLLGLSALLMGEPSVEAGAEALLGWGSTSGVAALAGMALEILRWRSG